MTTTQTTFAPFAGMTEQEILACARRSFRGLRDFTVSLLIKLGAQGIPPPQVPAWYPRCFDAYWKETWRMMPVGLSDESMTRKQAGHCVGHLHWMRKRLPSLCENMGKRLRAIKLPVLSEKMERLLERELDAALTFDVAVTPEEILDYEGFLSGESRHLENQEIKMNDLPAADAASFFAGKSQGILGPSGADDGSLHETSATKIYLLLILAWPTVSELPSVSVLHDWLKSRLGPRVVGEKRRVEKLCERMGLRLRGRGRPKMIWPALPHKGIGRQCTA